jgi:hypothetical protein
MIITSEDGTQTVDFTIPDTYKKLLVNCSGGADSALVLYLTVLYIQQAGREADTEINVTTCVNDKKGRWNAARACGVIDIVKSLTNTTAINLHYSYYRDVQDEKYFREIENALHKDNRSDLVVSGLTCNPKSVEPIVVVNRFGVAVDLADDALPVRNYESLEDKFLFTYPNSNDFYIPFRRVDKKWVADAYKQYNIVDTLFPITRSCESLKPEYFDKPCGNCWWCLERKWAFGTL